MMLRMHILSNFGVSFVVLLVTYAVEVAQEVTQGCFLQWLIPCSLIYR